jgi:hypothetical protein
MERLRRPLLLVLALVALAGPRPGVLHGQSQTTSALRGRVVDVAGTPVTGAEVRIRHALTGTERSVMVDTEGRFLALLLQPGGPYTVTVMRLGYAESVQAGVELQVGETRAVQVVLRERALELEGVSVDVERSAVFDPTQVGPVTVLDRRAVETVPILSRDVTELAALSPLVRASESGGFSVGGQNDRYNALLVDGLLNQDAFGLTAGGVPGGQAGAKLLPLDAVSQYEILVAPYDARLSGFAGGVMNAVTRTGTNDWQVRSLAVARHASLMGDLTLPSGNAEASGVRRTLLGATVSGPVVRDEAHVLVAAELEQRSQPPSGYNHGRDDPALVGLEPPLLEAFQSLFEERHDLDSGIAGTYPLEHTLANVFARLDWELDGGHRLTARNVFAYADKDEGPDRSPFAPYGLSSNAVFRTSTSNTTSVQLFSEFGNRGGHEVDLTVQRTTDRTRPASDYPQIEVVLRSPGESFTSSRPVRLGAEFYAQANDLSQTSARLTNTLTLARGRHTWSMGALATWYHIAQTYLPGSRGAWSFAGWTDVQNNAPELFQRTVLLEGQDPVVRFDVWELGAFVQDQLELGSLRLRFGLRLDVPGVVGRPEENPVVLEFFGRSTSYMPSGQLLLSPRIGFNWQRGERLRTQLRGGAGLFTGQLPFVWLANAFHGTGLRSVVESCSGRWTDDPPSGNTAPPFDPAADACLLGPARVGRTATFFDDGFTYPQYAKISAALDQEITPRLSASLGVIFSHSIHQVLLRELNISPHDKGLGPLRGYGESRTHFGTPSDDGFDPIRLLPGYEHVLVATNGGGDRSYSVSAELRGSITDRLAFLAGYAYARSYDRMSLASVDLVANYGLTPTRGDPNDPPLTPSNFDRPHKVVLALYGARLPGLGETEVSLLYTGESGLPFSYVYRGDLNGDGYPSLGAAFDRNNDLVYVPRDAFEVPSGVGTSVRLAAALATDPCLGAFQGQILPRNRCRAPWQNRLDARVAHTLHARGASIRLEADVINLPNLFDSDRGLVKSIGPVSPLLQTSERLLTGELLSEWGGGILPFRNDAGELVTPEPWSVVSPDSQWQAQLGVRVTFDRGR